MSPISVRCCFYCFETAAEKNSSEAMFRAGEAWIDHGEHEWLRYLVVFVRSFCYSAGNSEGQLGGELGVDAARRVNGGSHGNQLWPNWPGPSPNTRLRRWINPTNVTSRSSKNSRLLKKRILTSRMRPRQRCWNSLWWKSSIQLQSTTNNILQSNTQSQTGTAQSSDTASSPAPSGVAIFRL